MFGRVAHMLDKNAIIVLSVTAVVLLLAGLALAVTSAPAKAQTPPHPTPAKVAQAHTTVSSQPFGPRGPHDVA
jgi:hypothetical protein